MGLTVAAARLSVGWGESYRWASDHRYMPGPRRGQGLLPDAAGIIRQISIEVRLLTAVAESRLNPNGTNSRSRRCSG